MLRFKARRKSPALKPQGELTPSEKRVIRIIDGAMQELRREVTRMQTRLADAVEHKSADQVANMISADAWLDIQEPLQAELLSELLDAGSRVKLPPVRKEVLSYSFDRSREESARWAANEAGQLIREISDGQRQMVKDLVSRAQLTGIAPGSVAREIRNGIGLTTAQAGWVSNFYERNLTANIANGMSAAAAADKAQAAADRYQTQVHRYRASTIARTEIMRANSEGRKEAWGQGVEGGWIDPGAQKEWIAEADACEICEPLSGMRVPLNEEFPEGDPPAHPNCRCDLLLVDEVPQDIRDMTDAELDAEIESLLSGEPVTPVPAPEDAPLMQVMPDNLNMDQGREWLEDRVDHDLVDEMRKLKGAAAHGGDPLWRDGAPVEAALEYYTGNGFNPMNLYLRADAVGQAGSPDPIVARRIDDLAAAIRAAKPLDAPMLVYRGMRKIPDGFEAGSIFTEPGFLSTSARKRISEGFQSNSGIFMEIVAPRGARGIVASEYEDEVLFGPGTKLRVIAIETVNGRTTAYCEIVP